MYCFLFFNLIFSTQQPGGTLTIHAEHFNQTNGTVIMYLYRAEDDIPKKPFAQQSSSIVNGTSTIVIENIPYGEYAVILFQDENSNGVLDHRWGLPAEPMGFSNKWKLSLFSGMPNFGKLRFEFSEQLNEHTITVEE